MKRREDVAIEFARKACAEHGGSWLVLRRGGDYEYTQIGASDAVVAVLERLEGEFVGVWHMPPRRPSWTNCQTDNGSV